MERNHRQSGITAKVKRLILARLCLLTVFLGLEALVWQSANVALYILIGITYLLSASYALWLKIGKRLQLLCYIQTAADIGIITGAVWFTGGVDSPFVFLYALAIIVASTTITFRGAVFAGMLASLMWGTLVWGQFKVGYFFTYPYSHIRAYLLYFVAIRAMVFLLLALFTGILTERLSAQESELARLHLFTKDILDNMASGLMTLDREGRIMFANKAACELVEMSQDDVLGRKLEEVLVPQEGAEKLTLEHLILISGDKLDHEATILTASGKVIPIGYSASLMRDEEGDIWGIILSFKDLREIKKMQEELKHAERLSLMGKLAANFAHEIRNPLASMCGSIEVLKEKSELSGDEERLMRVILKEAERLNRIVTEFLEFAHPKGIDRRLVNLNDVVEDVVVLIENTAREKGITVERELEEGGVCCLGDGEKLKEVMLNICTNALDAMPDGGKLTVRTHSQGEWACICVEDTGVGMDEDTLKNIFNPFFTTKTRGIGLGLAISENIVKQHGGKIHVQSEPGKGTKFEILLPLRERVEKEVTPAYEGSSARG